jgi:hypothetical protein
MITRGYAPMGEWWRSIASRNAKWIIVRLCLISLIPSFLNAGQVEAQPIVEISPGVSTARFFDLYYDVFVLGSRSNLERVEPQLRVDGFIEGTLFDWRKTDATGTLEVVVIPSVGSLSLNYYPLVPVSTGDATLAALISEAEQLEPGSADSLLLRLWSEPAASDGNRPARAMYVEFSLRDGNWLQTKITTRWPE